jgi:hypothetical protein
VPDTPPSEVIMGLDEDVETKKPENEQATPSAGATLLPAPIASAISLVTRSSAFSLRLGTFIGGLALDGARVTTLTGLELSRAIIERVLSRAGRDVAVLSKGELGRVEAEGLLERSIATLHYTITQISFVASTGFHFSSTALSSAADLSQHLLATLDSILGSTDSSRAIASIITLIRREFQNPATGQPGEKVGVLDLLIGICGLALLQRWCKRLTDQEARERNYDNIVCWDVVILDDGRRGDVVGATGAHENPSTDLSRSEKTINSNILPVITTAGNGEILQTLERRAPMQRDEEEDEWPEVNLKERIMKNLPPDASVSITTETEIRKTITVEIRGAHPPDLSPPPGVEIVEENSHHESNVDLAGEVLTNEQKIGLLIPRYRVVYRTIRNKLRGTSIEVGGSEPRDWSENPRRQEIVEEIACPTFSDSTSAKEKSANTSNTHRRTVSSSSATFSLSPLSSPEPEPATELDHDYREYVEKSQNDGDVNAESVGFSAIPVPSASNIANQKRARKPMSSASSLSGSDSPQSRNIKSGKPPVMKKVKSEIPTKKPPEKKTTLRNALRRGSGTTLSNIWNRDQSGGGQPSASETRTSQSKPPWGAHKPVQKAAPSHVFVPQRGSSIVPAREPPRSPQRGNPNYFSSRDLGLMNPPDLPRSPSRASFYSIHERRRDSIVSQTDTTYSIHSNDTRPSSPTAYRTQLKAQSSMLRARSEKNITIIPPSPQRNHRRAMSNVPSIYTLRTNNSETSLVLAARPPRGAYEDLESLQRLMATGHIDGLFPQHHIVRNISRFVRFASASYGASFMRVMGITTASGSPSPGIDTEHHFEHHSFSHHTQLPPSTILLSSFVDPQGGTDSTGNTNTGVPMVHYVSLDHESKAVVLTCRGTLGFEDILTDMTCEYDDLAVRGKIYKVHKGIHASALRLISGNGSRVLATIAAALEEFPDFGLVMCGHSLGGGVTALLAIMISEPGTANSSFVTAHDYHRPQLLLISSGTGPGTGGPPPIRLPAGRPIHVYAYGPPAAMSPSLRLATRGLITTIVNGQDLVPYLSLGVLHDLQAVALAFKTDTTGAKGEVRARVWSGLTSGFSDKWYAGRPATQVNEGDDQWAYSALKALRASMLSAKLVPPGEVFCVETMPVLQRDAFTHGPGVGDQGSRSLGRPATRAVLRYVRDVEKIFGELRFGGSMLLDHSPGRYEASLRALGRGVLP